MTTTVWYADGPDAPRISPRDAVRLAGLPDDGAPDVTLGWTIERHPWIDDPTFTARTVLAGYGLSRAVNDGRITPIAVRLSAVPATIEANPPDIAVVTGVRRGTALAFSTSVGWADVLARHAGAVIVELVDDGDDLGGPEIPGTIVATTPRPSAGGPAAAPRPADEIDLRIGALVASLLPEEPTLQFGPGGVSQGIARALDRPVHIWSGLVTDETAALHGRGLLLGPVVAAYTWGGEPIRALAAAGLLRLRSSTITHDLSRLSATPRFVSCNTALQVGLDGSVNVERVGRRIIAAVGGHADFCVGASRSIGGLSIIALRSGAENGSSAIVPDVDVVSTGRSDIQVVVTEHGIADLRNVGDDERARRLIEIAGPQHRGALRAATASGAASERYGRSR